VAPSETEGQKKTPPDKGGVLWRRRESNPRDDCPKDHSSQALTPRARGDFAQTFAREPPTDPDLTLLLQRWPTLPEPIKAAIRALVGTVAGPS